MLLAVKNKKYSIGIIKYQNVENENGESSREYVSVCNCGTVKRLGKLTYLELNNLHIVCEDCGNSNFIKLHGVSNKTAYPYLEVLDKSDKGFKVKRTNLSIVCDDNNQIHIKENMISVLIYDLVNKEIKLYKRGKKVEIPKYSYRNEKRIMKAIISFFKDVDATHFIDLVSTKNTKPLYQFAYNKISGTNYYYGERKIYRGLVRLFNYPYMQILANAGFKSLGRFYNPSASYFVNKEGKSPKEILGLPKFMLKYIKEDVDFDRYNVRDMREAIKEYNIEGNILKEIVEIVYDEGKLSDLASCIDTVFELHKKYKYNNIKRLILYLFRETRINQGITSPKEAATLLRDYVRMCTDLSIEHEQYPKSLKKEHDIALMNYKTKQDAIKQTNFIKAVAQNDYKNLEYFDKEYSIIAPKEMDDLIKEGNELSHCVASYVEDVIEGKCKILFLRYTDNLDEPLVTIEVRNNNVRQAKGYANRKVSHKEREFINKWAKDKGLHVNYYY